MNTSGMMTSVVANSNGLKLNAMVAMKAVTTVGCNQNDSLSVERNRNTKAFVTDGLRASK